MDLTLYINNVTTVVNNDPTMVTDALVDNNMVWDLYIDN